jgi:hypothetical protein
MLSNIVPEWGTQGTLPPTRPIVRDVRALTFAMERMTPELLVAAPGEDEGERKARHLAATDILDDLLAEYASGLAGGDR